MPESLALPEVTPNPTKCSGLLGPSHELLGASRLIAIGSVGPVWLIITTAMSATIVLGL